MDQYLRKEQKFCEIVHRRIDPATALREQNRPTFRRVRLALRVGREGNLHVGKVFEHQRGQVSILAERQQILLVQRVDIIDRVVFNDLLVDEQRDRLVGRADAIHAKTAGQARHGAKQRFKRLCHVMRNEVLVNLKASESISE